METIRSRERVETEVKKCLHLGCPTVTPGVNMLSVKKLFRFSPFLQYFYMVCPDSNHVKVIANHKTWRGGLSKLASFHICASYPIEKILSVHLLLAAVRLVSISVFGERFPAPFETIHRGEEKNIFTTFPPSRYNNSIFRLFLLSHTRI